MQSISYLLQNEQIVHEKKDGIAVVRVKESDEGFQITQKILHLVLDPKTVLFLSGGQTPKQLYKSIADEALLQVGSAALVDERFGPKLHTNSNEVMIKDSGLLRYLDYQSIPFSPILQVEKSMQDSASLYDEKVRSLFATFQKSVGILGIGLDGHTAGLPAGNSNFQFPISKHEMVVSINNFPGEYKKRITMTFLGLSYIDLCLILVFGNDKKRALQSIFSDGSESEIPSRFYKREEIAPKTLLITDVEF